MVSSENKDKEVAKEEAAESKKQEETQGVSNAR